MSVLTTSVYLTDTELTYLDGKCSEKVQAEVNKAKDRISIQSAVVCEDERIAKFVSLVVVEAKQSGKLTFSQLSLRYCNVCGKSAGYAKRTRNTRWHSKGSPNHDRPLYMQGVDLVHRFISIQGSANLGCCKDCWAKAKPVLAEALKDVPACIPSAITGHDPRYSYHENHKCKKCGWTGHDGEMRQLNAVFGGTYAGGCPKCEASNRWLGATEVERVDGFTLVPVKVEVAP